MRAILATAIAFLIVFFIVAMISNDSRPPQSGIASMEFALQWTLRLFGCLISVISASGLLLVAAGKGTLERQGAFVLPLLAGLALVTFTWSLALGIALIAVAWIVRNQTTKPSE